MFGGAIVALQAWIATVANLKKKFRDGEAVGGVFMCEQWLFWRKNRDRVTVGDALILLGFFLLLGLFAKVGFNNCSNF